MKIESAAAAKVLKLQPEGILIGGLALELWSSLLGIPVARRFNLALTGDIDFLGTANQADALARKLNAAIHRAKLDDATPQAAKVVWTVATNERYEIDYLTTVVGLDHKRLARRAVNVDFEGVTLKVIHPVDCAISRAANPVHLPSKRGSSAMAQARLAMEMLRAWMTNLCTAREWRLFHDAVEELFRFSMTATGIASFKQYEIDLLQSVPVDKAGGAFRDRRWPQMWAHVAQRRGAMDQKQR